MGWVLAFFFALAVVAYVITGLVLLIVNFWWLILPALLLLGWWWYHRHPGVRAKRELRSAVEQGNQMHQDIRSATARAKADMDRIARDWRSRK